MDDKKEYVVIDEDGLIYDAEYIPNGVQIVTDDIEIVRDDYNKKFCVLHQCNLRMCMEQH